MERIRQELGSSYCHRCDYCLPCTAQIPISGVMIAKSAFKRMPKGHFFAGAGLAVEKAVNCTECGECEARCPYHLPIRKMMSEQLAWYQLEKKKYQEECRTA
jgi:uncharacterized protein